MEDRKESREREEKKDSQGQIKEEEIDFSNLPGPKKAAILLMALGEDVAEQVIKNLPEELVEKLTEEMANLNVIPKEVAENVAKEFVNTAKKDVIVRSGLDYIKNILSKVFSPARANAILERLRIFMGGLGEAGINTIRNADPAAIANFISKEHPQVQAVILAYLGPKKAVEVLQYLPPETYGDLLRRIANLDRLGQGVLDEIGIVIDEEFSGLKGSQKVGGLNSVVEIIQNLPPDLDEKVLSNLEKIDKDLAQKIRESLFTFDDLAEFSLKTLEKIINPLHQEGGVEFRETLLKAIKGLPDEKKKKFLACFPERIRKQLIEELKSMGPIPKSEVEEAKRKIVQSILKYAREGKIVLPRRGEEFVE